MKPPKTFLMPLCIISDDDLAFNNWFVILFGFSENTLYYSCLAYYIKNPLDRKKFQYNRYFSRVFGQTYIEIKKDNYYNIMKDIGNILYKARNLNREIFWWPSARKILKLINNILDHSLMKNYDKEKIIKLFSIVWKMYYQPILKKCNKRGNRLGAYFKILFDLNKEKLEI